MVDRRTFLAASSLAVAGTLLAQIPSTSPALDRFHLGSISDEWSQDFETALKQMKSFGLSLVEIRTLWNVYNTEASADQRRKMKDLLDKYGFKVSVIDTAVYKCALPKTSPVVSEKDAYPYSAQLDVLKRGIERAHQFDTDKVRIFSFWRVSDPHAYFARIAEELMHAAETAKSAGVSLVLENESACNVATGHEQARIMKLAKADNLGMNWDIGNGWWEGEKSYPDGYDVLDKKRIWHMHIKDVRCAKVDASNPKERDCKTVVLGEGQIDIAGQLHALLKDKYTGTMSLEPEVEQAGLTHLEATRRSCRNLLDKMNQVVQSA